jgi:predicted phage-related endonuclease
VTVKIPAAQVQAEPGSRLEALLAQYDDLRAKSEEAAARFDALTAAIKNELAMAAPGHAAVETDSPDLRMRLRLVQVESRRIDSKRLQAEAPDVYERFVKKSTAWQLKAVR